MLRKCKKMKRLEGRQRDKERNEKVTRVLKLIPISDVRVITTVTPSSF